MSSDKYYRTPLRQEDLRALHARSNFRGFLRLTGHLLALLFTGSLFLVATFNSWIFLAIVILLLHGTCFSFLGYAGASHELSHNTVFERKETNSFFLRITSFLTWSNYVYFARTHTIHHRHTLESHVDVEVPTTKCIAVLKVFVTSTFDVGRLLRTIKTQWNNSHGVVQGPSADLFPPSNTALLDDLKRAARTILVGQFTLIIAFAVTGWWQLILLVNLAPFIGNGLPNLLASAQHCGKMMDTGDYRESTRTVVLNPILSFLYWNMNYHVEHHMYPGVPCYNLRRLHRLLADDLEPPTVGIVGILEAVLRNNAARSTGDCRL